MKLGPPQLVLTLPLPLHQVASVVLVVGDAYLKRNPKCTLPLKTDPLFYVGGRRLPREEDGSIISRHAHTSREEADYAGRGGGGGGGPQNWSFTFFLLPSSSSTAVQNPFPDLCLHYQATSQRKRFCCL